LYTNVVFFCFFSSDPEEKKAPGRGSGGGGLQQCRREKAFPREKPPPAPSRKAYIRSMHCTKKRLPAGEMERMELSFTCHHASNGTASFG